MVFRIETGKGESLPSGQNGNLEAQKESPSSETFRVLLGPEGNLFLLPHQSGKEASREKSWGTQDVLCHWGEEEAKGSLFLRSLVIKKDV